MSEVAPPPSRDRSRWGVWALDVGLAGLCTAAAVLLYLEVVTSRGEVVSALDLAIAVSHDGAILFPPPLSVGRGGRVADLGLDTATNLLPFGELFFFAGFGFYLGLGLFALSLLRLGVEARASVKLPGRQERQRTQFGSGAQEPVYRLLAAPGESGGNQPRIRRETSQTESPLRGAN